MNLPTHSQTQRTPMLEIDRLVKHYGAIRVTDEVSLSVHDRQLHAIIGPNGAGKTTLIGQITGNLRSESGRILFAGKDLTGLGPEERACLGLLRSYQITSVFDEFTVLENLALAALGTRGHALGVWRSLLSSPTHVDEAQKAMHAVGLQAIANVQVSQISYGERRQLELGMALAAGPRFLLLDEPMAGMSPQESAVVVALLQELKKHYGILLIEHDMNAVFALADWVTVLADGRVMFSGTVDEVKAHPEVRRIYLGESSLEGAA